MSARFPRAVAIIGGVFFIAVGIWAMVDPHSFFETAAKFEREPRFAMGGR